MSVDRLHTARAQDILRQVQRQLRREALFPMESGAVRWYLGPPRVWSSGGAQSGQVNGPEELTGRLQALYTSLDGGFGISSADIGEMPPVAHTFRGAAGRFAIGILQRLMWWYTRSLRSFAGSVGTHLQASTEAIEVLSHMLRVQQTEISSLREEVRILRQNQTDRPESPH
jgi:hypothetical protein